jgi:hypothetical protein
LATFVHGRMYALILAKRIGRGYTLGDSFSNSSGHPVPK